MWPQILVIVLGTVATISAIAKHGSPLADPNIDASKTCMVWVLLFFLLGSGGFWKVLGW